MIIIATGPIVALLDASDNYHAICKEVLKQVEEPLLTTWPVLIEAFYLLGFSWKAQDNLWEFIMRGGMEILTLTQKQIANCRELEDFSFYKPKHIPNFTLLPSTL